MLKYQWNIVINGMWVVSIVDTLLGFLSSSDDVVLTLTPFMIYAITLEIDSFTMWPLTQPGFSSTHTTCSPNRRYTSISPLFLGIFYSRFSMLYFCLMCIHILYIYVQTSKSFTVVLVETLFSPDIISSYWINTKIKKKLSKVRLLLCCDIWT